ncbi:citrate lyase acyl carrier protein [Streptococcus merionis]|uniref:Citrate lyase acyl carrier protein n=1 Tax=Streptococcus merionis TaxID=400065 RepID=A0A239SVD6_9STRE|nr:citrate lyase acyl carrier protein [Streptococcus merionis]SNU88684.1 citrate lyase subunit gamma [Streptococcus merionis]
MSFEIKQAGLAGTVESSDIQVLIEPSSTQGIELSLESSVEKQFGRQIRKVILETVQNLGITSAKIEAVDKGALDCTVKARVIAAAHRASDTVGNINWEEIEAWNV